MDKTIRSSLNNIYSEERELQHDAYIAMLKITDEPVNWAYEIWDEMVLALGHKNNRVRSIASQILINLAKSDPEKRILNEFDVLLEVTKDKRFVTARHCLQAIWKIGLAGDEQLTMLLKGLETRFRECSEEKNCTLIRSDIIQGLRNLIGKQPQENISLKAQELIELETDLKYRKKYERVWRSGN
jgi:hypothetical protein